MNRADLQDAVADERMALADLLQTLTPEQLNTWSLCASWKVPAVAAHLTTLFNVSMPGMTVRIARNRFSFGRAVEQLTAELAQRPIEQIAEQLRANARNSKHPPTLPLAPLTDLIVHGEDIRRPLGLVREIPFERVSAAMEFVTGGRAVGFVPANRIRGLRFMATDGDGIWGSGQIVHGPALSLLLGALGRRVAFADLGGSVEVLSARLETKVARIA
ncbi:unannotated protein [freshwater metagenome]|uniref:Unannotated protein n=1 Tax=freshwater metagenome TaxID=449393 RepID=A0A6J7EWL7_9ZZZZ|nr:maleylpyruvate isomerase family mycothiol-dependent enzyme [Actinomycetota bacterium]